MAAAGVAAAGAAALAMTLARVAAAAAGLVAAAGMGAAAWRRQWRKHLLCVCVCVVRRERVCACVGDVCVRMRGCGWVRIVATHLRPPRAQRRATLLANARRTARHWQGVAQQSYAISSGGGGCT